MSSSNPLAGDRRLIRLTDDTYVFGTYPFCGVVITDEGCLAIDGPMSPRNIAPWKEFIDHHGVLRYQIYCEHHQDHITSGPFLEPEALVSSERTRREMAGTDDVLQSFDTWASDPAADPRALDGFEMRFPTLLYTNRLTIELGGKHFVLIEAPGHTAGSTVVHAVEDRVAFVADNGFTPAIQSGDPFAWLQTIAALEALDVDWYVQGHGDPLRKVDLAEWRRVLLALVDRARQMRADGLSPAEVVQRGGLFTEFARVEHTGSADRPPRLTEFSSTVLAEQGVQRVFDAIARHDPPSGSPSTESG